MRVNVYAEELPDPRNRRAVEVVTTTAATGRTFYGGRIYLRSAAELHDRPDDDDRSAVTIWGPPDKVAKLLRQLAGRLESANTVVRPR